MTRRVVAITVALVVLLIATPAEAEPGIDYLRLRTPSTVTTDGGSTLRLPPGYFLGEAEHAALDAEVRRLQDAETRLEAENEALRADPPAALTSWRVGLGVAIVSFVAGIFAGYAALN